MCAGVTTFGLPSTSSKWRFKFGNDLIAWTIAYPRMWVNDTLPPRVRARWLLMTTRLSIISLAGTARTLVAVGICSEAAMFLATAAAAPRRTLLLASVGASPAAGADFFAGASFLVGASLRGAGADFLAAGAASLLTDSADLSVVDSAEVVVDDEASLLCSDWPAAALLAGVGSTAGLAADPLAEDLGAAEPFDEAPAFGCDPAAAFGGDPAAAFGGDFASSDPLPSAP